MNAILINISLFQAGWFAAVFSAAASVPILGTLAIAVAVATHLARSPSRTAEARLLAIAGAIGFAWESLLVATGLVQYDEASAIPGTAPYWIVAMWLLFATTLNVGMRWLRKSMIVTAIVGAIGGPLSFLAGQKAGAVSFPDPILSLAVIGLGWAVFLPLLVRYAARADERAAIVDRPVPNN
ncbi:MAG: DUF2878 domain-containing protein [Proteobacteria bacterium]|nr:DUF2878 domain-containing protein [Pseudomonadota bacterium]